MKKSIDQIEKELDIKTYFFQHVQALTSLTIANAIYQLLTEQNIYFLTTNTSILILKTKKSLEDLNKQALADKTSIDISKMQQIYIQLNIAERKLYIFNKFKPHFIEPQKDLNLLNQKIENVDLKEKDAQYVINGNSSEFEIEKIPDKVKNNELIFDFLNLLIARFLD